MHNRMPINLAYLALLALSLGIPLLHHYQTERAIETMRPMLKMEDGTSVTMLLPAHVLLLRWFDQLSSLLPVSVFTAFLLSFWREAFARPTTLLCIAICQCLFTTIYALYSTWLLGSQWVHHAA